MKNIAESIKESIEGKNNIDMLVDIVQEWTAPYVLHELIDWLSDDAVESWRERKPASTCANFESNSPADRNSVRFDIYDEVFSEYKTDLNTEDDHLIDYEILNNIVAWLPRQVVRKFANEAPRRISQSIDNMNK